jgi:hypothetical protein
MWEGCAAQFPRTASILCAAGLECWPRPLATSILPPQATHVRRIRRQPSWAAKKSKQGFRGYPVATIALYGPTDKLATKIAVSIFRDDLHELHELRRWFSERPDADIRGDHKIEVEIREFLRKHAVQTVSTVYRIIGCPHEQGIDYPEGQSCPQCPFWAGRDRFTGEMIQ